MSFRKPNLNNPKRRSQFAWIQFQFETPQIADHVYNVLKLQGFRKVHIVNENMVWIWGIKEDRKINNITNKHANAFRALTK